MARLSRERRRVARAFGRRLVAQALAAFAVLLVAIFLMDSLSGQSALASTRGVNKMLILGCRYHSQGNLAAAEREFRSVVQLDPNNAAAWSYLGLVLFKEGKRSESERAFVKAAALNRQDLFSNTWLGIIALGRGRIDDAERIFSLLEEKGRRI